MKQAFLLSRFRGTVKRIMFLGMLLALCLGGVIGAQVHSPKQPEIKSGPGRYQIVVNPEIAADVFLLDTETGRTWVRTVITDLDGRPTIWLPKERMDSDEEFTQWSTRKLALQKLLKDTKEKNQNP